MISALSDGPVAPRFFRVFPSFCPPEGFPGRSAVIRQRYPDDALLAHLATPPAAAAAAAALALQHSGLGRVRITTPSGTDLSCELKPAQILPFSPDSGRHVYLPPAEVTYGILAGSASGVVGGRAVEFSGGSVAKRLAACFDRLDREQTGNRDGRLVVELGFGLSVGEPVGLGAPDECLQGTCHFGIGNDFFYGGNNAVPMHMDVIMNGPVTIVPA